MVDERVVVAEFRAPIRLQNLPDIQGGGLAHVVDVWLVRHPDEKHVGAVERATARVEESAEVRQTP